MTDKVYELLTRVRQQQPVVHHLTNWVTIYDCAQIVKTIGGSPVMAHAPEEVADMVKIASALVLNIGTLTTDFVSAMVLAAQAANRKGIPIVLDACGAGATPFRDQKTLEILESAHIDIIKGNASEIARVAGQSVTTKGVDATAFAGQENLATLARNLAAKRNATVVVTGKEDLVATSNVVIRVGNGHQMMTHVVGTGCMAASVIGAFAAVEPDRSLASACALCAYGVAAELAATNSSGPIEFKHQLFDALYKLDQGTLAKRARLSTSPS